MTPSLPVPALPQVHVRLLDTPELHVEGQAPLRLRFKDGALLARLALEGGQSRARLAAWLWPLAAPEGARANLRQRISRLQNHSRQALLKLEGTSGLALGSDVGVDLLQIDAALAADADAARGELLGAASVVDEPAAGADGLTAWLAQARDALRLRRRRILLARIEALQAGGSLRDALAFAQRLVDEEPGEDQALCHLLKLHHALGEHAAAAAAWQRDARLRRRQDLAPPGPEAQALRQLIGSGRSAAPPAAVAAPSPAEWAALVRPPRLVGRAPEWSALAGAWAAGRSLLVLGHAGLGKTRLVQALADAQGLTLRLAARPGERLVPYALLGQLVERLADRAGSVDAWARSELARLWPALGAAPDFALQPLRLLHALRQLLRGAPPLLLDDLHHADAASAELLPGVLEAFPQVMLACRQDAQPPAFQAWVESRAAHLCCVTLQPWDAENIDELLALLALPPFPAADWTRPLLRHTGGHPLLLLGTLQALLHLPRPDPRQPLPVPDTLAPLLAPRLRGLQREARELAVLAACARDGFGAELALACFPHGQAALALAWQELQAAGLLDEPGRMHDLVAEAVLHDAAAPDRMAAHGRLAAALAQRGAEPALLAGHWSRAGAPGQAAECHERAARLAGERSRRQEEAAQWQLAAEAWTRCGDAARAFQANVEQAWTLVVSGSPEAAQPVIDRLCAQARTASQHAQAQAARAHRLMLTGEFAAGADAAAEAAALAASAAQPAVQRDAALLAAAACAQFGRLDEAQRWLDEVDALDAPQPVAPLQQLKSLSLRCHVLDRVGRLNEAIECTERAIGIATAQQEHTELMTLLINQAVLCTKSARVPAALEWAERALALAGELGQQDGLQAAALRMNLGAIAAAAGRYRTAVEMLSSARRMFVAHGAPAFVAYAEHHEAMLWMMLGQPARAMRLLAQPVDGVPNTVRVRRLCLRGRLQRWCGVAVPGADWRRFEIDDSVDVQVAETAHLELARTQPPELALRAAGDVERRAQVRGLVSAAQHARLVALDAALRQGDTAEAARRARLLMAELPTHHPSDVHWPELPWTASRALAAAGAHDEADAALDAACGWIDERLRDDVDDVWRTGYTARNRVNQAVLAARARRAR